MHLLIHACCAPCVSAPIKYLAAQNLESTVFFYNPNIQPWTEYRARRDSLLDFCQRQEVPLLLADDYALEEFLRGVVANEAARCAFCYQLRLTRTAQAAREGGFTHFTTSLLISPYQKHELLREIGLATAARFGVEFWYQDWRPLWSQRHKLTKELNLYRQQYCGCVYSEKERYLREIKAI